MNETTFLIEVRVRGDEAAAERAVELALDEGVLQDFINEYDCDEGRLRVESALCTGTEAQE